MAVKRFDKSDPKRPENIVKVDLAKIWESKSLVSEASQLVLLLGVSVRHIPTLAYSDRGLTECGNIHEQLDYG